MTKWMLLIPLALMACGDKTEDTAEEGGEATVQPQEGAWTMSEIAFISDTCGFDDGPDDTGSNGSEASMMNLTLNTDGSYSLEVDEELDFSCNLSGQEFTCDTLEMSESEPDADMTFISTFNISGTFTTNTAFNGDVGMEMTCDGADCEGLAEFGMNLPCSMAGTFTATAE